MHHFWDLFIEPLLSIVRPVVIVEIGADFGDNTRLLLDFCEKHDAVLHSIDPLPKFDVKQMENRYGRRFVLHRGMSLNMLPLVHRYEAVLIDGDHNWYTVYNELKLIEKTCQQEGRPFPLVFLHDIEWPYARRDLYYYPENIPDFYRKPYRQWGISPDSPELLPEGGLNRHLNNAIYENSIQNGVLTAVEDFLKECRDPIRFLSFPGLNGLGLLLSRALEEKHPELLEHAAPYELSDPLKRYFSLIEKERNRAKQALSEKNENFKALQEKNSVALQQHQAEMEAWKVRCEQELDEKLKEAREKEARQYQEQIRQLQDGLNILNRTQETLKREQAQAESDVERLIRWIEDLLYRNGQILRSKRWKTGNFIGNWGRRLLFRPKAPSMQDYFEKIREEFTRWSGSRRGRSIHLSEEKKKPLPVIQGPPAQPFETNRISIIILNRDGAGHLRPLFESFLKFNTYPDFEFIVVDHRSQDESRRILQEYQSTFHATLIFKSFNDTFSRSNNHGALLASGEYLFFLNNDIVFHSDPLHRLVAHLEPERVGLVCPLLLYPPKDRKNLGNVIGPGTGDPLPVQHSGIRFFEDQDSLHIRGYNLGETYGTDGALEKAGVFAAVTGAALLCRRDEFFEAGGFFEGYNYGKEDIDLCLTYLTKMKKVSLLASDTSLIHEESATQNREKRKPLHNRRTANWDVLRDRFGYGLRRALRRDRFSGDCFWSDGEVNVAFAVTEAHREARAGDYYTALELATACEQEFGWKTRFLAKNENWYDLKGVDLLIVMVDGYDLEKVSHAKTGLIKLAWMRNWFDRWAERPSFDDYDIFLASCGEGARFVERAGKEVHLFPIATNSDRFQPGKSGTRTVDVVFTGHKWGVVRDIEKFLSPSDFPGSLEVYGNGWENHEKFGPYWRGFVPYERLPEIYSRARIVIDDAVEGITKPWGSVNSRVFDALAAGALVVTNGVKGSDDLFEGRLPGYADGEQLRKLIRTYGENEPEREKKAAELREMVLAGHTYRKRARELREILVRYCEKNYRIALKVPVPDRKQAHTWGDYHFALSLKRALVKQGHSVRIDLLPEWERREDFGDDVVLVLRGLSRYEPKRDHINLMWNISHADKVSFEEYEKYDHVFVASARFAEELKTQVRTPVTPLFQCTDPERFYRDRDPSTEAHDILFVGNSRKQNRPIISDALAGGLPVAVYGADWDGIIDEKHLLGKHIENENLRKYYSSCGIVLNDHWPFMRDNGFISNRIFDAGACGACIVSDAAAGLEDLFGDAVSIYRTPEELKQIVEGLLADPGERKRKGEKLETLVRNRHRFSDRAETLLKIIDHLNEGRKDRLPIKKEVFGLLGENGGTEAIAVSESAGSADKAFPLAASIQKA